MIDPEQAATQALEELLAAACAAADKEAAGDPDAANSRLMVAMDAADGLALSGPVAALAKIWTTLKGAEIAFGEECVLNFAEARDVLLRYFYTTAHSTATASRITFPLRGA